MTRPLRYGMVGGGRDAFIGAVHRTACALDGEATLVAGALSSDPEKARASGADLGLDPSRAYPSWQAMLDGELALPAEQRIEFVSIVTPNHVHSRRRLAIQKTNWNGPSPSQCTSAAKRGRRRPISWRSFAASPLLPLKQKTLTNP